MDYTEVCIFFNRDDFEEVLEAELAELQFESFLAEPRQLKAYIPTEQFDEQKLSEVVTAYAHAIASHQVQKIEHQNWNEVWEASYDPVWVNDEIYIRAPFHQPDSKAKFTIVLEPNMSFGTGHHPTTHMMLQAIDKLSIEELEVCDFGCGSGVLAIYAGMKGAKGVGIEIDAHAAEAARSNLELNDCERFNILTGGAELLLHSKVKFDVILANINRNVIEECCQTFHAHINPGGYLLCAGFLDEDADDLLDKLEQTGFHLIERLSQNGWTMLSTQTKTE